MWLTDMKKVKESKKLEDNSKLPVQVVNQVWWLGSDDDSQKNKK